MVKKILKVPGAIKPKSRVYRGMRQLNRECMACDRTCTLTAPRDTDEDDLATFLEHSGFDWLNILGQDTWAKPSSWIAIPDDEWPLTFFCCIHANVEHPDSYKPPPSRR